MCGISGFVSLQPQEPTHASQRLRNLGRWLHHRGPDDWGEFASGHVALGHNRLAIIDLEYGQQPMHTPGGELSLVYNGEIYNYRELWDQLQQRGHVFATDHSDSEVILNGYLEWGTEVFRRLDGMFAFGLWDHRQEELILARDRAGIKPLYYAHTPDGGLAFASELKALLRFEGRRPELRAEGLSEYFLFRASHGSATLVEGIHRLEPGRWLRFSPSEGQIRSEAFWACSRPGEGAGEVGLEELESLMEAAVESHLLADVPVGTFLSGGVDSSLVTAMAQRSEPGLSAFTIGTRSRWDESPYAARVASDLGMDHRLRVVEGEDFLEHFDDWSYVNDEPCADPSALALMVLAGFARDQGMKVMLAGEGADELFGGYNAYLRFMLFGQLASLPGSGLAGRGLGLLCRGRNRDYAAMLPDLRYLGTGHLACGEWRRRLLLQPNEDSLTGKGRRCARPLSPLQTARCFDFQYRLPDDVLSRTDRATMYFGLETRVPFLSNAMIELGARLRDHQCASLWGLKTKKMLKVLAERFVPHDVVHRPKRGFDLPVAQWLNAAFTPKLQAFTREQKVPGLDYQGVKQLLEVLRGPRGEAVAGVAWAWLVLETWYRRWFLEETQPICPEFMRGNPAHRKLTRTGA